MPSIITDRLSRAFADFYINVKDPQFGAKGDGVTNDTLAIQTAIDAAYAQGGGTVYIPSGTFPVTTLTRAFTTSVAGETWRAVNISGDGPQATRLATVSGSAPMFHFSNALGADGAQAFGTFSGFSIEGNGTNDGIKITNQGNLVFEDLMIEDTVNAINGFGLHNAKFRDLRLYRNAIGVLLRRDALYPDHIWFDDCIMSQNTSWAIDYGGGAQIVVDKLLAQNNGTAANQNTGAIVVREDVPDSTAMRVSVHHSRFIDNDGITIKIDTPSVAVPFTLLSDVLLSGDEIPIKTSAGIGASARVQLDDVTSLTGTVELAGLQAIVAGGFLTNPPTNNATYRAYLNTFINGTNMTWFQDRVAIPVVAAGSLPAAGAIPDGHILIENVGAGDRNLILYAGGQRFRIDGGAAF